MVCTTFNQQVNLNHTFECFDYPLEVLKPKQDEKRTNSIGTIPMHILYARTLQVSIVKLLSD